MAETAAAVKLTPARRRALLLIIGGIVGYLLGYAGASFRNRGDCVTDTAARIDEEGLAE